VLLALVWVPILFGLAALAVPSERLRPWLLPAAGAAQMALVGRVLAGFEVPPEAGGWIALDDVGRVVLATISLIFFFCSIYAVGYLGYRTERPNRLFCFVLPAFLGLMSLMVISHHLGLMWVAIESATLAAAPLLRFSRTPQSLEATWKYLLIGSVGIALALFGSFFLAYSALQAGLHTTLLFDDLMRQAPLLSKPWLHAAFVLLFVGYGTKMGLAPMHTWKPDAYGESPGLVGALLAGGLTNCAFLAIVRFHQIMVAAGEGPFARRILVVMGLVSMGLAGVFVVRQRDYKRMLAYSSVEHMGILVLGLGLGGAATFAAVYHMVNNALAKTVTFLAAGNLHRAFGSKRTDKVTGAVRHAPVSGWAFLIGFLAITGAPPFGPFQSMFAMLTAALGTGRYLVGALFVIFLTVVYMGMGAAVFGVCFGEPPADAPKSFREGALTAAPIVACLALVLGLGVWLPGPLEALLHNAAAFIEGGR